MNEQKLTRIVDTFLVKTLNEAGFAQAALAAGDAAGASIWGSIKRGFAKGKAAISKSLATGKEAYKQSREEEPEAAPYRSIYQNKGPAAKTQEEPLAPVNTQKAVLLKSNMPKRAVGSVIKAETRQAAEKKDAEIAATTANKASEVPVTNRLATAQRVANIKRDPAATPAPVAAPVTKPAPVVTKPVETPNTNIPNRFLNARRQIQQNQGTLTINSLQRT